MFRRSDIGMVTVEGAIAICAFVVVLGMALGAVSAVLDQLRCTDAAREAARLTARGEPDRARAAAGRIAPRGAELAVQTTGDEISVRVNAPPVGRLLPGLRVSGEAYAIAEPDAGPDQAGAGP
jgi:Flp pilus assembly protein TadG